MSCVSAFLDVCLSVLLMLVSTVLLSNETMLNKVGHFFMRYVVSQLHLKRDFVFSIA